jgi:hypothetical protein
MNDRLEARQKLRTSYGLCSSSEQGWPKLGHQLRSVSSRGAASQECSRERIRPIPIPRQRPSPCLFSVHNAHRGRTTGDGPGTKAQEPTEVGRDGQDALRLERYSAVKSSLPVNAPPSAEKRPTISLRNETRTALRHTRTRQSIPRWLPRHRVPHDLPGVIHVNERGNCGRRSDAPEVAAVGCTDESPSQPASDKGIESSSN